MESFAVDLRPRTIAAMWLLLAACWTSMTGSSAAAQALMTVPEEASEMSGMFEPTNFDRSAAQVVDTRRRIGTRAVAIHADDEVWLVSARNVQSAECCSPMEYLELTGGKWLPTAPEELAARHQQDRSRATVVYVHGNRTNLEYAKSRGLQVYGNLFNQDYCLDRTPVRFVIFAWRSESELPRPLPDFKIKWDRSNQLGPIFQRFLQSFGDRNMALIGFSLGAQVVASGMTCDQHVASDRTGKYQVAMIAPALNPAFVCRCLPMIPWQTNIERTAVFINRNDRAIQFAEWLVRMRCGPGPTTLRETACQSGATAANPIQIFDMTAEVANCHSIARYTTDSSLLRREMQRVVRTVQQQVVVPPVLEDD